MVKRSCRGRVIDDPTWAPVRGDPFSEDEKLAFVANSLHYHRVRAIETKADEHNRIGDLFMSDLVRKRLALRIR